MSKEQKPTSPPSRPSDDLAKKSGYVPPKPDNFAPPRPVVPPKPAPKK